MRDLDWLVDQIRWEGQQHAVVHEDCLRWMKRQPDDSVALVLGSPPYEDARTYGIDCKLKGQDWVDWMVPRVREAVRICRGLVALVVEGKTRNFRWSATPAILITDLHRAGVHLRKPPAFYRVGIPGSGGPDWLRNDYEFIVCCTSGGRLPWSDNTAMGHPCKYRKGGEVSHRRQDGRRVDVQTRKKSNGDRARDGLYHEPAKANPGNVIQQTYTAEEVAKLLECQGDVRKHKVGGGLMGSQLAHENEAPFPEDLAEFFVRSFCPPGGIVYDPFCGSGTVAAVCELHGRRSIGTEIRESQVELTQCRIKEAIERKKNGEGTVDAEDVRPADGAGGPGEGVARADQAGHGRNGKAV